MNHFSLFTGIGGIDIAASWAGFTAVGMCEIDDYCRKVLESNIPRVATGVKNRVNRLKCLGNAVVPAQVYPILKAISEIERGIQK